MLIFLIKTNKYLHMLIELLKTIGVLSLVIILFYVLYRNNDDDNNDYMNMT